MRWNSKFIVGGGEADECHLRKHLHMPLPLFFNSLLEPEINQPHITAVKNGNILEGRLYDNQTMTLLIDKVGNRY